MSGILLKQARLDMQKIVSSGGFEEDITFSNPDDTIQVAVKGLTSGIWIQYDAEGNKVNSSKSHVSVTEQDLLALGYPTRSITSGKIALTGHKVSVKDASGVEAKFVINETSPNATTGLIVCLLGKAN